MDNKKAKNFVLGGPLLYSVLALVAIIFIVLVILSMRGPSSQVGGLNQGQVHPSLTDSKKKELLAKTLEESGDSQEPLTEIQKNQMIKTLDSSGGGKRPMTEEERKKMLDAFRSYQEF